MTNGTTNTLSLKNTSSVTRDYRIAGNIELSVVPVTITSVSYATNVVTVTVTGGHGIPSTAIRVPAFISGLTFTGTNHNGNNEITYISSTQFSFPVVGVTAVTTATTPQFVSGHTVGTRLAVGASGSLSPLRSSECRGYFFPFAGSSGTVTLELDYMVTIPSNHEVAVYVANFTSTNNLSVNRAKLIANAIL
jgi:hypothetical protein